MGILDTPFLAKLTNFFKESQSSVVYTNQKTVVLPESASVIQTRGFDTAILEISGTSTGSDIAILGVAGGSFIRLPIHDLDTGMIKPKLVGYPAGRQHLINTSGFYSINISGYSSIRIAIYNPGSDPVPGISVRLSLSRTMVATPLEIPVSLASSRTQRHTFNATQMDGSTVFVDGVASEASLFFNPRDPDKEYRLEKVPHMSRDIFEQCLFIINRTDKAIYDVGIAADLSLQENAFSTDFITDKILVIDEIPAGQSVVFYSDKSDNYVPGIRATAYMVPELRLPIMNFRLTYRTGSIRTTTGTIALYSMRRY